MDIWFVNLNFKNLPTKTELNDIQHFYSENFLKTLLSNFYNNNSELSVKSGKKYLKDNSIYFSISHSGNLVVLAFDKNKIGIDAELLKDRNYSKILKYFGIFQTDISQEEFYKIWTVYEAEYKSETNKNLHIFKYKNYICSLSSENPSISNVYEINIPNDIAVNKRNIDIKKVDETLFRKISLTADFLTPSNIKIKQIKNEG